MSTTATSSQAQAQAQVQAQTDKTVTGYPVAYAYAAPPPPPPLQQTSHRHVDLSSYYHRDRQAGSTLLRRLIVIIIAFLTVMALVSLITWLVFRPQLPEFRVDSGSVSRFNTTESTSSVSATWQFILQVKNPNEKLVISCNSLRAVVAYAGSELATTQLAPFSQEKGNETQLQFQLRAVDEYVGQRVVSGIQNDRKTRGRVDFDVWVLGLVQFKTGWWEMRWRSMKVSCEGVNIGLSNNVGFDGNLTGRVDPCRVAM
ncbi:NDR1/HIN1-like protein 10 [Mangifera indica]|uniref:NDR1/HIN1-like protein 10 n=1 Tax=Mangifera indica TaxID=29780 RepID=UPI001CFC286B|nr:NDR1/HIN1-like protein 10 [Mangifera indica]